MKRQPIETRTRDGWVLRGEALVPDGAPVVAVLGHAMMTDRRTMLRGPNRPSLGRTLAEKGIETMAFDLRGHGESGPTTREGGSWDYDAFVREDVPALIAAGRERARGRPVVLVGHSLAAHAGVIAAGRETESARIPDAIVALAANLWCPRLDPHPVRLARKTGFLLVWAAATRAPSKVTRSLARATRMGEPEPWPYVRQFLRIFFTNRLVSADGREDYGAAIACVRVPILSVSSEGDRLLAHPEAVARFLAPVETSAPVTHRVVRGGRAPDHMGLCVSPSQRPLWEEIADWILARTTLSQRQPG